MGPTASETGTLAARRNGSNRVRNSNTFVNHPIAYPGKKASSENSAKPAEIPIRSDVRKWNESQLSGVTVPFSMLLAAFSVFHGRPPPSESVKNPVGGGPQGFPRRPHQCGTDAVVCQ